jgi:hypothetical protein
MIDVRNMMSFANEACLCGKLELDEVFRQLFHEFFELIRVQEFFSKYFIKDCLSLQEERGYV